MLSLAHTLCLHLSISALAWDPSPSSLLVLGSGMAAWVSTLGLIHSVGCGLSTLV